MMQKSRWVISYSSQGPNPSQTMQSESEHKVTELIPPCGVHGAYMLTTYIAYVAYMLTTDTSKSGYGCI